MEYRDDLEFEPEAEPDTDVDDTDSELKGMLEAAFSTEFDAERIAAFKEMVHGVSDEPAFMTTSSKSKKTKQRIVISFE